MNILNQQITTVRSQRPLLSANTSPQRVDWKHSQPKTKPRKIYVSKYQGNLNGNLSKFMSSNANSTFQVTDNNKMKLEHKYKSGRVIIPTLNTEVDKYVRHKRQLSTIEVSSNCSKGDMKTLFDKTPLIYEIKGKKRVSNSVDKKYEHKIFSEEFLLCKNHEPFIGMMHKRQSTLHKNDESITDNQVNCKTITNYGMKRIYPISYKSSFVHL